ncbi:MAG: pyruvate:ferredoxin (flavodoxin) oxidoreductase [Fimbriimonadaceae bacterium]|nr:pyruvate:ferredoxin (flavodoxin) oxidoreductase [Fimbriimonadaceae bacterium]
MSRWITIDGNEAAARVAYKVSEVIAIYPITPSSNMGESCDEWSAKKMQNLWGQVPTVQEMQSEGGAAGAVHGALQAGSLCTTFTASQGLLLMIPNMFKIAGELTPTVFHISARTVATHALSIFGDHSDVMATRTTGWGMVFGGSPQEVQDMALIAHAATLKARIPFLNCFDGFRTSHEVQKIEAIEDDQIRAMIDEDLVRAHRERALSPDHPVLRGSAQNPDVFFQARETVNPYYDRAADLVQETMDRFAEVVGRRYGLFDYVGDPKAERVVVLMGSGAEAAEEAVEALVAKGEKVGLVKVRLYRPFDVARFVASLPDTVKAIAVLDRTKEPGAIGEPLYQDVVTALSERPHPLRPLVIGGRYGLSSKEFTPAMVKAVLDELTRTEPKNHFTVGIVDDVGHTSLGYDPEFQTEDPQGFSGVFWGLGADGTVGANKNSIKIIGEGTDFYAQGYFVYDSKKSGSVTVSHLRFGPNPIRSTYLVQKASFVAVHQFGLMFRYPVLDQAAPGGTVLINSPYGPNVVWNHLPRHVQEAIVERDLKLYVIDGYAVAQATGMGVRINTIMQTAYFALSGILPKEEAIDKIRTAIEKTYGRRGPKVVAQNFAAVDQALAHLFEVHVPGVVNSHVGLRDPVPGTAPAFVKDVIGEMIAGRGDLLPVSALPVDGTFPTATTQYEKRGISLEIPVWEPDICSQCGKCILACPHGVIRAKIVPKEAVANAPEGFKMAPAKFRGAEDAMYVLKISVEDCTGCALCTDVCPEFDKSETSRRAANMVPFHELPDIERERWEYFLTLPDEPSLPEPPIYDNAKALQLLRPLFEFSGACAGCGETPYLKILSQLYGDHLMVANATGCSSIYGGNLPTTPWAQDSEGRGPAWSNSLFEDNAEFGLGMRLALDAQRSQALRLLEKSSGVVGSDVAEPLLAPEKDDPIARKERRTKVEELKKRLAGRQEPDLVALAQVADALVDKSVWIIGGDGWAYDIGYGGLDHVLASGRRVRCLVLDTEVYSNTGGQMSKATPRGAVAKFAAGGKPGPKKDLGRMAMTYGNVYVAEIAMGADDNQTIKAIREAEAHDGPSLIIAYSHCIAHAIDMRQGFLQQKRAVETGYWPLYRYNPARAVKGRNPMQLDSKAPSAPLTEYIEREGRYQMLRQTDPESAARLTVEAQQDVDRKWAAYAKLAAKEV